MIITIVILSLKFFKVRWKLISSEKGSLSPVIVICNNEASIKEKKASTEVLFLFFFVFFFCQQSLQCKVLLNTGVTGQCLEWTEMNFTDNSFLTYSYSFLKDQDFRKYKKYRNHLQSQRCFSSKKGSIMFYYHFLNFKQLCLLSKKKSYSK